MISRSSLQMRCLQCVVCIRRLPMDSGDPLAPLTGSFEELSARACSPARLVFEKLARLRCIIISSFANRHDVGGSGSAEGKWHCRWCFQVRRQLYDICWEAVRPMGSGTAVGVVWHIQKQRCLCVFLPGERPRITQDNTWITSG